MLFARLHRSNKSISKETSLPRLINTTTHHSIQSTFHNTNLHINKFHFSIKHHINNNVIKSIKSNKLHSLQRSPKHIIRSFANNTPKEQRTFNQGLSSTYTGLGFNANPWKISLCGLLGGFCGALCGVGGGIVMIPLLRNITTMTAHQISGTSLVAVAAGALFATANYTFSADVTRVPIALNMAIFSMAMSVAGARLNAKITGKLLSIITGTSLLCCIPGIMGKYDPTIPPPGHGSNREDMSAIIKKHIEEEKFFQNNRIEWYKKNWQYCAIGCVSGFLSGLIGIGGGVVMTAAMIRFTDLSQHEAVATSLLCIAPTALIGSVVHYRLKHVVTPIAILLGVACSIGMSGSSHFALEVKDSTLKAVFCAVLAASSTRILYLSYFM